MSAENHTREAMTFDVVIIGAGVAGLSAAIRLKQLAHKEGLELSVCVLEKGSEIGSHILSGAIIDARSLTELLPNWQELGAPVSTAARVEKFLFLGKNRAYRLPCPPQMHNKGNYIISLGELCKFLATQAQELGVEIFPGFAATELLFHNDGSVRGVATGDFGQTKDGEKSSSFQAGIELCGKQTIFAEGARGYLSEKLCERFNLREESGAQTYAIGIKELWRVKKDNHRSGEVTHSIGWPLDNKTYGGGFIYHWGKDLVSVGFVIGLDYSNPWLSPYDEFQRFKTHPSIRDLFTDGQRLSYGARALTEGGFQAIPKLSFAGGMLIGCGAGFMNVPRIKGSHTAMKSGILAADAIGRAFIDGRLKSEDKGINITEYESDLRKSWLWFELKRERNIRPGFRYGLWLGMLNAALSTYIFRGKEFWTLSHSIDHKSLKHKDKAKKIEYPKYDGKISFDKMSSVYLSGVNHREDQPCHLKIEDESLPIKNNLALYAAPEERYCPAGVYEIVTDEQGQKHLQINATNCVHCKTCDIKDPEQNILWTPPEGGGGPNYPNM